MKLRRAVPLLLLAVLPMLAPGTADAAARWRVVPSPSPSDQANYLSAAVTVTAADAWAVGAWYRSHTTSTPGTLTEHWDGAAWTVVPSPNATDGYNELYGVAAVSSTDVWAVGYHNIANYGSEKTMALHWNGTNWALVPTANIGPNANTLKAVTALARNDVWAVGFGASTNNQVGLALAQHWNGNRWSLAPTPPLGAGFTVLNGVDAAGTGDVWAVGSHGDDSLIEHWNGSAWSVVPSPNGARPENELYSVSVVSSDDVWAVGESSSGTGSDTLIEHWDGSAWTVVPGPNGSKSFTSLTGVTATSASDAWAVGSTYEPLHAVFRTFTAHWDGAAWTAVPSPNPSPEYDYLQGVAAVPGAGPWAVGAADVATLAMQIRTS